MEIGRYADGRALTYDETSGAFKIGDTPVTVEQVQAYETAGDLQWATYAAREWFEQAFPTPQAKTAEAVGKSVRVVFAAVAVAMILSFCGCFVFSLLISMGD